ncbi:MAG: hypothetical protein AB7K24_09035 [Gemmataceae bacterium]
METRQQQSVLDEQQHQAAELPEQELEQVVAGAGKIQMQDLHFTTKVNKSSP